MGPLDKATAVAIVCTRDRARAMPFYRDVLGLKLTSEDPFAAVFDIGGVPLRLSTVADWTPHAHTVLGFNVADIQEAAARLAGASGPAEMPKPLSVFWWAMKAWRIASSAGCSGCQVWTPS